MPVRAFTSRTALCIRDQKTFPFTANTGIIARLGAVVKGEIHQRRRRGRSLPPHRPNLFPEALRVVVEIVHTPLGGVKLIIHAAPVKLVPGLVNGKLHRAFLLLVVKGGRVQARCTPRRARRGSACSPARGRCSPPERGSRSTPSGVRDSNQMCRRPPPPRRP